LQLGQRGADVTCRLDELGVRQRDRLDERRADRRSRRAAILGGGGGPVRDDQPPGRQRTMRGGRSRGMRAA
jgi:hypothetical protein